MLRKKFDIDPADTDADGICESQTTAGAANLTLDGVLCDSGTAAQFDIGDSYSSGIGGVQLSFTSAGDISGVTFTITGKDENGTAVTETVTGPNATTVETTKYYSQVTQIAADGAVGTAVTVGTVDEVVTKCIPVNWRASEAFTIAVLGLSGTISYTIQETFDNTSNATSFNWIDAQAAKTADLSAQASLHATAVRLVVNSYTNGAELQFHVLGN